MMKPIVLVHGWSDDAEHFKPIADYLAANASKLNRPITTLNLANWISLEDEITFNDLREAMQNEWKACKLPTTPKSVDILSHSTGALVVRDWMTHFYTPSTVPIHRHVMMAPANHGSYLAHQGRSWYGRAIKGSRTGFETGTNILNGLELASPYTYELAERDIFSSEAWYGKNKIMATVLVGNSGYDGFASITSEEGGDGTVRISSANLNASKLEINFHGKTSSQNSKPYDKTFAYQNIAAFGIMDDENHSSVVNKKGGFKNNATGQLIIKALNVRSSEWDKWNARLDKITDYTIARRINDDSYFHEFTNMVTRVNDSVGNKVEDYLLEFAKSDSGFLKNFGAIFQRKVIQDVHNYSGDSSYRSFFFDLTKMYSEKNIFNRGLAINFDTLPYYEEPKAVGYEDMDPFILDNDEIYALFSPHRTVYVDAIVKRKIGETAFTINPYQ